ncbi:phage tail protein [Brevibacillus sp. SYSU BS000544]|uniref:phage tail protein n=1 Tax=Brevibacillus sp. SYSU BS000544 TaxID=3416443 RepID=UPI003CE50C41
MTDGLDGFRFLVINKKRDWEEGLLASLTASDEGITLQETFDYFIERSFHANGLGSDLEIKDFSLGDCHVLYLLDANTRRIYFFDPNQNRVEKMDFTETFFSNPSCITYTSGSIYVVEHETDRIILNFNPVEWKIRWTIGRFHDAQGNKIVLDQPIKPIDLAIDINKDLYVLDQNNLAIVQFDGIGRLVSIFGQKELYGKQPIAIALSPEGALFVLERQEKKVLKFVSRTLESEFVIPLPLDPSGLCIDANGHLFIGDQRNIVPDREDDRFIYRFSQSGNLIGAISGYRGSVKKIMMDAENRLYVFDEKEQKITILKRQRVYEKQGNTPVHNGVYYSKAVDSAKPGTQWHKLVLESETLDHTKQVVSMSENMQVKVSYRIADHKTVSINGEDKNLDDFLADPSVLPMDKDEALKRLDWSVPLINPKDMLIRGPVGRYLWLRLELIGTERITPAVKNIRAVFPRTSYLRYLPAVYQEEESSRDFLERFLSLFETFFVDLESEINHITRFFDANAVSGDFLRWLSTWLSITADEHWPEEKLRRLVKKVPELYKMRGTRRGIEETITIFTDIKPMIIEAFQLQRGEQKIDPYSFYVFLPPFLLKDEHQLETARRILELEKPAHTCAVLSVLEPSIYLDKHTYLEVNTYLWEPTLRLDCGAKMQRDTILR